MALIRSRMSSTAGTSTAGAPLYDFTAPDGVRHTVWRIADPAPFVEAFRAVPLAYVADGHHRSASAWRAGRELRNAPVQHRGSGEYNWFLAVLFPADELRILPYNRLVRDCGGMGAPELLGRLSHVGRVTVTDDPSPPRPGTVCFFLLGAWYRLELDESTIDRRDPIASLDVSLLQDRVLGPILGVGDPRTDRSLNGRHHIGL